MERNLNAVETHRLRMSTALLFGLLAMPTLASTGTVSTDEPLEPESRHEKIGELVATFIQKSHYSHIAVNYEL